MKVECFDCSERFGISSDQFGIWSCPHCQTDNVVEVDMDYDGNMWYFTTKPTKTDYDQGPVAVGEL